MIVRSYLEYIFEGKHVQLNVKAFAMTAGLLWGIALFGMTWWLIVVQGDTGGSIWLSKFYLGYDVSPLGSVIGLAWAVPDGAIGGAVFAWLYNRLAKRRGSDA